MRSPDQECLYTCQIKDGGTQPQVPALRITAGFVGSPPPLFLSTFSVTGTLPVTDGARMWTCICVIPRLTPLPLNRSAPHVTGDHVRPNQTARVWNVCLHSWKISVTLPIQVELKWRQQRNHIFTFDCTCSFSFLIYSFMFSCTGSSLLHAGFSLWWLLFMRSTGSRHVGSMVVARGLSCCTACEIFWDQGLSPCPLLCRQTLNHCASSQYVFQDGSFSHTMSYDPWGR